MRQRQSLNASRKYGVVCTDSARALIGLLTFVSLAQNGNQPHGRHRGAQRAVALAEDFSFIDPGHGRPAQETGEFP